MRPLYQCILSCGEILVAARDTDIDVFDNQDGTRISSHSLAPNLPEAPHVSTAGVPIATLTPQKSEASSLDVVLDSEPPNKKRRISGNSDLGVGFVQNGRDDAHGELNVALSSKRTQPRIISLLATESSTHLIVVTGEDKTVTVFHIQPKGRLLKHSQRTFPKRLCAIVLTPDESDILCADKFGDVYSIPLLPLEEDLMPAQRSLAAETGPTAVNATNKAFVPAASFLTVHSVRNRKALEYQKRPNQKPPERTELLFKHQLLLGHVSMLTDVAILNDNGRWYIATADRDEHIRISRGIPNAHIVEGFCLGHQEFVSRLCVSTVFPQYLISGGGDDDLYVWHWVTFRLVQKVSIKCHVDDAMKHINNEDVGEEHSRPASVKVAVTKILSLQWSEDNKRQCVAVICEAVPAVFLFLLNEDGSMIHHATLMVAGNVLDMAQISKSRRLILSLDRLRGRPGFEQRVRNSEDPFFSPLQKHALTGPLGDDKSCLFDLPKCDALAESGEGLVNLLYQVEKLRKRHGEETFDT